MDRIYISAYEKVVKKPDDGDFKADTLIRELGKHYELCGSIEFQGYEKIESEINSCRALLAMVDSYWTSSTWKASELTYANCGVGTRPKPVDAVIVPKPTFVYWKEKMVIPPFMRGLKDLIYLPENVEEAVAIIGNKVKLSIK